MFLKLIQTNQVKDDVIYLIVHTVFLKQVLIKILFLYTWNIPGIYTVSLAVMLTQKSIHTLSSYILLASCNSECSWETVDSKWLTWYACTEFWFLVCSLRKFLGGEIRNCKNNGSMKHLVVFTAIIMTTETHCFAVGLSLAVGSHKYYTPLLVRFALWYPSHIKLHNWNAAAFCSW